MEVHIGPTIQLRTKHGEYEVSHVTVQGTTVSEGVVLRSLVRSERHLVRVQSSCLFSESFWATNCDCALQLQGSLELIAGESGFVAYFYEEGRGAGLAAKFKAIELQQAKAMDTEAAYQCLNISVDSRRYEAAAGVINRLVGREPVRLLSNNPGKVAGLTRYGINVVERVPLVRGLENAEVRQYLQEKVKILRHEISELNDNQ